MNKLLISYQNMTVTNSKQSPLSKSEEVGQLDEAGEMLPQAEITNQPFPVVLFPISQYTLVQLLRIKTPLLNQSLLQSKLLWIYQLLSL